MVEKGKSDITVSRLMRLVHWFGVSVADLVQEPDNAAVQVVRAGDRRSLRLADEGIEIQMLTPDGHHAMMPVINVYDEGGGMVDPTRHDGEEFVHVLDGRLELTSPAAIPSFSTRATVRTTARTHRTPFATRANGVARFFGITTPPNL